jgi:1-phosphatidylinositol phosphodiesterase
MRAIVLLLLVAVSCGGAPDEPLGESENDQRSACGDGVRTGAETCDDGNTRGGDGCSRTCEVERGFGCPTDGAACVRYDGRNWMSALRATSSLTRLAIPGTHDSGARIEPLGGTAKCQDASIADQLAAGVRYLDIRCRHQRDRFEIHHGPVYQELRFEDVLTSVEEFLATAPREAIFMSISEEHTPADNTRSFEATFDAYVQTRPSLWHLAETVPTLGEALGKIVLIRRFSAARKGIDATAWQRDTTFTIDGPARLRIQDRFVVRDVAAKWDAITTLFRESESGDPRTLFVSFTSGYKPGLFGVPNIPAVATPINGKLDERLDDLALRGVVVMDFVNAARASAVFTKNF